LRSAISHQFQAVRNQAVTKVILDYLGRFGKLWDSDGHSLGTVI
jgi:hypothetical protein